MRAAAVAVAGTLSLSGVAAAQAVSHPVPRSAPLVTTRTWAFSIGAVAPVSSLARYDMVVVDGVDTPKANVVALHRRGVRVVAYMSVGTIEEGRPWTRAAAPYRLDHWGDWNEWYADVADAGYRSLVLRSMVGPVMAKGFDGVFLDNIDMVESHPAQTAGMTALVRAVSARVRARHGVVIVQNGDAYVRRLAPYIDGWNREDVTATYDFDDERYAAVPSSDGADAIRAIRWMRARKKLVTTADYTATATAPLAVRARARACAVGARPFVSDINLRRLPAPYPCAPAR